MRNSGVLPILLRELEQAQERDSVKEVQQNPVQVVIDFNKTKKGEHKRNEIKFKGINS